MHTREEALYRMVSLEPRPSGIISAGPSYPHTNYLRWPRGIECTFIGTDHRTTYSCRPKEHGTRHTSSLKVAGSPNLEGDPATLSCCQHLGTHGAEHSGLDQTAVLCSVV